MSEFELCKKCILPESKPGISFKDGVCNACQVAEANDTVDWDSRWDDLLAIADKAKKKSGYNILVPVSGGKDSTHLALTVRDRLGLTPLCVNVAPCEPTPLGERNLANLSRLGFDVFRFFPNQKIMPELAKRSFYEDGDPCTSHEFMLYSIPQKMAMLYGIKLITWGENCQTEYGNPDVVCGLWGRKADHWLSKTVTKTDLIPFELPTEQQVEESGLKSMYLSDHERWDSRKVAQHSIDNGMEIRPKGDLLGTGGYWDFEQLDDESPVIGHYLKYQKFGYGRATDQACRDIRLGYITREHGLKLAEQYDGHLNPVYSDNFCKYIGIDDIEFHRVCKGFYRNPVIL